MREELRIPPGFLHHSQPRWLGGSSCAPCFNFGSSLPLKCNKHIKHRMGMGKGGEDQAGRRAHGAAEQIHWVKFSSGSSSGSRSSRCELFSCLTLSECEASSRTSALIWKNSCLSEPGSSYSVRCSESAAPLLGSLFCAFGMLPVPGM